MTEKRSHPRILEDADVTVKIKSAPEVKNFEGMVFSCQTKDISMRGVQLQTSIDIQIGALLELDIVLKYSSRNFLHIGNVVWKTESNDGESEGAPCFNVGIRFNEVSNPQFNDWVKAVTDLLGNTEII